MSNGELKLPYKPFYRFLNGLGGLILVLTIAYLIINWKSIPDTIPTHFNAAGEADKWGGKGSLVILPVLSVFIYGLVTLIEHFPSVWNTGVSLTPQNSARVLLAVKGTLVTTKFAMVLTFSFITWISANGRELGSWFMLVFLFLTFGPMVYYLIKIFRKPPEEKNGSSSL